MPEEALKTAAEEMMNYRGSGMSVMEISHRSSLFQDIYDRTVFLLRSLMKIPDDYDVLMLQGGATGQFSAVPMNLLHHGADYIDSGYFAYAAMREAEKYGPVHCAASTRNIDYKKVPDACEIIPSDHPDYLYYTANNTIYGTAFQYVPAAEPDTVLVCDMSSCILSGPCDVSRFGVIIAGAQKNIGPAGLTIVIVRKDLLGHAYAGTPSVMNWTIMSEKGSMLNTPPTYAIYMAGLCLQWLYKQGGVDAMEMINRQKAEMLYSFLDRSRLFHGTADKDSRSIMNVTFRSVTPEMDREFIEKADEAGLCSLSGHRRVGGMRASIYNAMPLEGVKCLVDFMEDFEAKKQQEGIVCL